MAVPRTRTSNARKNSRRSHHAKKPQFFGKCTNCGESALPHKMCMRCGFYSGRPVIHAKRQDD